MYVVEIKKLLIDNQTHKMVSVCNKSLFSALDPLY